MSPPGTTREAEGIGGRPEGTPVGTLVGIAVGSPLGGGGSPVGTPVAVAIGTEGVSVGNSCLLSLTEMLRLGRDGILVRLGSPVGMLVKLGSAMDKLDRSVGSGKSPSCLLTSAPPVGRGRIEVRSVRLKLGRPVGKPRSSSLLTSAAPVGRGGREKGKLW